TMPSLETEVKRLPSIPGTVPPVYALPEGCRFAPRCPHAKAQCHQDNTTIHYIQETHKVRSHLFTEKGELAHDGERSFAGN
ncbi:oligopeptide/dipeptide ABC transporter ATP-binding protein, partial [Lysinibacillus sp. D4B1_S16]|uniref:oligopeptide/dipeptide ABC transporter ATP-binding protein n=1 Tax=Lysinibacillus sp. D4B1_S16 TaxID=2941231 RepID=UPI0037C61D73